MRLEFEISKLGPEIDYVALKGMLSHYSSPRDKITKLLRKGILIRVKKGLYVVNPEYGGKPFSQEIVANLIYGPSYISLQYALAFHGLTPERVEEVTSITSSRAKVFETTVGRYSYRSLPRSAYPWGVNQIEVSSGRYALIAIPEKALLDTIWFARKTVNPEGLEEYLFKDLRIDETVFSRFSPRKIETIGLHYPLVYAKYLAQLVRTSKRKNFNE